MTPEPTLTDEGKKCVCSIRGLSPVCAEFQDDSICHRGKCSNNDPANKLYACGHLAACHAQPTNAVTQRGE
jgi:hypothetical protein